MVEKEEENNDLFLYKGNMQWTNEVNHFLCQEGYSKSKNNRKYHLALIHTISIFSFWFTSVISKYFKAT
jgi:hypothetical protein